MKFSSLIPKGKDKIYIHAFVATIISLILIIFLQGTFGQMMMQSRSPAYDGKGEPLQTQLVESIGLSSLSEKSYICSYYSNNWDPVVCTFNQMIENIFLRIIFAILFMLTGYILPGFFISWILSSWIFHLMENKFLFLGYPISILASLVVLTGNSLIFLFIAFPDHI